MSQGRRPLAALIASCAAIFWPGAFAFGLPGVMAPYWQQAFGVGRGAIGAVMFFLLAGVGCFMFLAGRWQLKLGVPKVVAAGSALTGGSALILAFAPSMAWVYFWAYFCGMAQSFVYVPALTTVQHWYPARRGLVSGLASLVFAGAAAVMAPVLAWLLLHQGYVIANLLLGAGTVAVGVAAAPLMGLPQHRAGGPPPPPAHGSLAAGPALRTASFWLIWGSVALMGAGGIAMVTLSTALGVSRGLSLAQAVLVLTAFNLGSGGSRLVMGWLSDLVERTVTMSYAFWAAGLAYLALPWAPGLLLPAVLALVVGFAFGTMWAVAAPLVTDCFGPGHFGEIFGLLFTSYGFLSGLLGPFLAGRLLDAHSSFTLVFCYLAALCLAAGWLIRLVRPAARAPA